MSVYEESRLWTGSENPLCEHIWRPSADESLEQEINRVPSFKAWDLDKEAAYKENQKGQREDRVSIHLTIFLSKGSIFVASACHTKDGQ